MSSPLRPTGPFPCLQGVSHQCQSSWVWPRDLAGTVQHCTPPRCWAMPLGQWDTHPPSLPHQRPSVVNSRVRARRLVAKWLRQAPSFPNLIFHVFSLATIRFHGTRWALRRRAFLMHRVIQITRISNSLFPCAEIEDMRSSVLCLRLDVKVVQPGKVLSYFSPFLRTLSH